MPDTAHTFELYAGMVQDQHGETLEVPGETMSMVVREPVGVTVGITPWNYPMLMAAWKAGPALAAGNVMILKPATVSPLTNLELARIFEEAGLPKGVFQVVTGPGGEVGDYLAGHQDVDMIAFTGSVEVGKHIMRKAAENVKKIGLELGGKSPNIVFADADFEAAIDGALIGIFAGTGRGLLGRLAPARRALHPRPLRRRARQPRDGDQGRRPARRGERDGPARRAGSSSRRSSTTCAIGKRGGRDARDRRPPARAARGFYYEPTIFVDVDNDMRIAQEEIFGPVLVVIPFDGRGRGDPHRQRHHLRARRRRLDEGRHARDARDQGHARRHHVGEHLPPDLQRRPVRRLQAERHRPRARQLRARRVHRGQADQHRPHRPADGRVPVRQAGRRRRPPRNGRGKIVPLSDRRPFREGETTKDEAWVQFCENCRP